MKNNILLLKTLLLSTSRINLIKHSSDKKMRKKAVGGIIALVFIYGIIMFYMISLCVGYGQYGIIDSVPTMCAIVISSIGFMFTFFKTNGYLFNFKEYDMLIPSRTERHLFNSLPTSWPIRFHTT